MARRPPLTQAWQALVAELDRWAAMGRMASLWWRDDDAAAPGPLLDTLLALGQGVAVPALAVVPDPHDRAADLAGLAAALPPDVPVLQHGARHQDRAPGGEKKCEFPTTVAAETIRRDIADGAARLHAAFGGRLHRVFVPPWNRLPDRTHTVLADLGFGALSAFAGRPDRPRTARFAGIDRVDTHVDITDWHRSGGPVTHETDAILAGLTAWLGRSRAARDPSVSVAIGLLTHHLVLDDEGARFIERLVSTVAAHPGGRWTNPTQSYGRWEAAA